MYMFFSMLSFLCLLFNIANLILPCFPAAVKILEELESSGDDAFVTASTYDTLPVFTGPSNVSTVQPGVVVTDVLPSIAPLPAATSLSYSPSEIIEQSLELPDSSAPAPEGVPADGMGVGVQDIAAKLDHIGATSTAGLYEGEQGSGFISVLTTEPAETTPAPVLKYVTTSSMTTAAKGKELVVFFSLRGNQHALLRRPLQQEFDRIQSTGTAVHATGG